MNSEYSHCYSFTLLSILIQSFCTHSPAAEVTAVRPLKKHLLMAAETDLWNGKCCECQQEISFNQQYPLPAKERAYKLTFPRLQIHTE